MPIPRQKTIVVILWSLAFVHALRQGLDLPQAPIVASMPPTREFSGFSVAFGLIAPSLCVLFNAKFRPPPWMDKFGHGWLVRWIDRRWGDGSAHAFLRAVRPLALLGVTSFVMGGVGLVSAWQANATPFAFELASFGLAAGIGAAVAHALALRLMPETPWV